ncbi:MAG: PHP domain-containing protein [Bacillota bacterium]
MKLFADYHTHTTYSHGRGSVADNVLAAKGAGLTAVAVTDHGPGSLPWLGVRELEDFEAISAEAAALTALLSGMRVLSGVEANVISVAGTLDVPPNVIAELDVLLAGLHPTAIPASLGDAWKLIGLNGLRRFSPGLARRARLENTKALVECVYHYDVDIVTHPGLQLPIDTAELARAAAARDTALEINCSHGHMTAEFVRVAAKAGASFAINSDAHRPQDVGRLERGLSIARQAGLRADQVINAVPGPESRRDRRSGHARVPARHHHRPVRGRQEPGSPGLGGSGLLLHRQPSAYPLAETGGAVRPNRRQPDQSRLGH